MKQVNITNRVSESPLTFPPDRPVRCEIGSETPPPSQASHCTKYSGYTKRVCVACSRHFVPVGKENICPDCERGEAFKKTCIDCGNQFDADDPFQNQCNWCHSEALEQGRGVSDLIDNR